jgi:hypothetical protein
MNFASIGPGAALCLSLAAAPAVAATYYFSDCQPGAASTCVAGNNGNAGTSAAAPKRDLTGLVLTAGDTYRFARGGAWVNFSIKVALPGSSKARPTVFTDYIPSVGRDLGLPILRAPAGQIAMSFTDGGAADHDEGYVVSNLELRGSGNSGKGIFVYNDADHITVDGIVIDGFEVGVQVAGFNAPNPGSNGESEYFTLRNSVIRNNSGQGFLGAGPFLLIENNAFDNNGFRQAVYDHNLYVSRVSTNATVRGNTLTRNARVNGGPCASVSLVAHGAHPNLVVEDNVVFEDKVGLGCFGIDLNSSTRSSTTGQDFSNLVVRGNKVIFADPEQGSGQGIGCSSCPGALIENNTIVHMGRTGGSIAINVPSTGIFMPERGDKYDTNATVRNNSIYIASTSTGAVGVRLGRVDATRDSLVSNLIVFAPGTSVRAACFLTAGRPRSSFYASSDNLCYRAAGATRWSDQHPSLAEAQAAGFDTRSRNTDPKLTAVPSVANDWSLSIQIDSPAVGAGPAASTAPAVPPPPPTGIGGVVVGKLDVKPSPPAPVTVH